MDSQIVINACRGCGTQLAPTLLACPRCGRLVKSEELEALASQARDATERDDIPAALAAWREALELLPVGSKQHQIISAKITELGENIAPNAIPVESPEERKSASWRVLTSFGAVGLLLWKLKALLFGLSKGTTLLSMLLSMGVYWTLWGWKFALGIVLSIYVHEMGHVIALRRYGFKSNAPMFIPGIGALVRMHQHPVNPREDAEIGLAGPIYGLGAALIALGLWLLTRHPVFAAISGVGAWLNLLNLLPISPLDGGRGFHAMSRAEKFLATLCIGGAWLATQDGMLILLGLIGIARVLGDPPNERGSLKATVTYCLLIVSLAAVSLVRLQVEGIGGKG